MLETATTKDTFNLKKTSTKMPALGHHFGANAVCGCGKTWNEQQENPQICPKLMARLQTLEDLDRVLQRMSAKIRSLEAALADSLATCSVGATLENILRHLIRIESERKAAEKKTRRAKDGQGT